MSDHGNGNGNGDTPALTVKQLVLRHDEMLRQLKDEIQLIKGGIAVTVAVGLVNFLVGWLVPVARAAGH